MKGGVAGRKRRAAKQWADRTVRTKDLVKLWAQVHGRRNVPEYLERAIESTVMLGAEPIQIESAILQAATHTRIDTESQWRYALGILRSNGFLPGELA